MKMDQQLLVRMNSGIDFGKSKATKFQFSCYIDPPGADYSPIGSGAVTQPPLIPRDRINNDHVFGILLSRAIEHTEPPENGPWCPPIE